MSSFNSLPDWGLPPWKIDFTPPRQALPPLADFAVIGAGFTGLAAAAWLRLLAPEKSVVVLEAGSLGAGASGRTGGMALSGSAADDLVGLEDVLGGLRKILGRLSVNCDLSLPGAWEIARKGGRLEKSPIRWNDSGALRVTSKVPGGTLDPGKLVSGLARAVVRFGGAIFKNHRVSRVRWGVHRGALNEIEISSGREPIAKISAAKILFATNGFSQPLSGLAESTFPKLTLAALTEPLAGEQIEALGLAGGNPFYTVDFPYLWGRLRADNSIVLGAGLIDPSGSATSGDPSKSPELGGGPGHRSSDSLRSHDLTEIRITDEAPARLFSAFHKRIRGLHPALASVEFTHRWGGPILFRKNWKPVFGWHPESRNVDGTHSAIVIGAFAGHGVALSSFLGAWATEVFLGKRNLPSWGAIGK